jgi:hypothetical protein
VTELRWRSLFGEYGVLPSKGKRSANAVIDVPRGEIKIYEYASRSNFVL